MSNNPLVSRYTNKFVYVMDLGYSSYYKIGSSVDPEDRLRTLQGANPTLSIMFTVGAKDAHKLETHLHKNFSKRNVTREIFTFEDRELPHLKKYIEMLAPYNDYDRERKKLYRTHQDVLRGISPNTTMLAENMLSWLNNDARPSYRTLGITAGAWKGETK